MERNMIWWVAKRQLTFCAAGEKMDTRHDIGKLWMEASASKDNEEYWLAGLPFQVDIWRDENWGRRRRGHEVDKGKLEITKIIFDSC
jgi:hypothetical protein